MTAKPRDERGAGIEPEEIAKVAGPGGAHEPGRGQFTGGGLHVADLGIPELVAAEDAAATVCDPHIKAARILPEVLEVPQKTPVRGIEGMIVGGRDESDHLEEMIEIISGG
jgi:hypothetical protein